MKGRRIMNERMKKLLLRIQEGMPISVRPYRDLGEEVGLSESEAITYLAGLRRSGLLKRMDFCIDARRLGSVSTLVACRISKEDIPKAKKILDACNNVTHNYLRRHRLNMWFTLSAASSRKLNGTLGAIKDALAPLEFVSLPTERVYKLRFQLHPPSPIIESHRCFGLRRISHRRCGHKGIMGSQ